MREWIIKIFCVIKSFALERLHWKFVQKKKIEMLKYDMDMDLENLRTYYRLLGLDKKLSYEEIWDQMNLDVLNKNPLHQWSHKTRKSDISEDVQGLEEYEYKEMRRFRDQLDKITSTHSKLLELKKDSDQAEKTVVKYDSDRDERDYNGEKLTLLDEFKRDADYLINKGNPIK